MAAGAAQIEDARTRRHELERGRVRARHVELGFVMRIRRRGRFAIEAAIVEESHSLAPGDEHRPDDIRRVLEAVHVADLIAVIGRNRDLLDALSRRQQLDDDLGVEMEFAGVEGERNLLQRGDRVHAIAGVELAQCGSQHPVLEPGQDPVAGEFVQGHAATQGGGAFDHPRSEHGVGFAVAQRSDEIGQTLGRVLSIAMQQRHEIEPAFDGEVVADLLVPPVPLVHGIEQDV